MQPGLGHFAFSHDGYVRDFEKLGRFVDAKSPEESQLDNLRLAPIDVRQSRQCFIERNQIKRRLRDEDTLVEREHESAAPAFGALSTTSVIYKNATHKLG